MQPEDFAQKFNVSRESFEKLEMYHALLVKWQKAINLVGPKTIQNAWQRHFEDSAQLLKFIPESTKTLVDIGSGAGFPALVLAITRPDLSVHVIESDERKAQFMRTVSRETNVDITVHNCRIESAQLDFAPDFISARALADLSQLFTYCLPWADENPELTFLFMKGKQAEQEIAQAQKHFSFACEASPSITDAEARILLIKTLKSI